eukprot:UC1_evm1s1033
MKISFAAFCLTALLAAALASNSSEPEDSHYSCGCAAAELNFTIDCSKTADVTAAIAYLDSNCTTKESCHIEDHSGHDHDHRRRRESHSMCQKSWGILASHHDHCLTLVTNEEEKFHSYKNLCGAACEVARQYDPNLSQCPAVDCTTTEANAAVTALQNGNCASACTSTA